MKIAINGFGRIGRIFFRQVFGRGNFEVVAVNDLSDVNNLSYLLKYDTVYGRFQRKFEIRSTKSKIGNAESAGSFIFDGGKEVLVFQEKDPAKLPWKDLNVDTVIESTGFFTTTDAAKAHITAGAKKVIITAPAKDEITPTTTPNLNYQVLSSSQIFSNASCTTNSVNPVVAIMLKYFGVKKAILNTVHAYTATQSLVDGIAKGDFRKGRAAGQNIVPATTGASEATARVIPEMKSKFKGMSIRVPVVSGSLSGITFLTEKQTTIEEINKAFKEEAAKPEWQGIMKVVEDPITSADIIGEPYGSIVDLTLTQLVGGDLAEIFSWYDNEWGYTATLIKQLERLRI